MAEFRRPPEENMMDKIIDDFHQKEYEEGKGYFTESGDFQRYLGDLLGPDTTQRVRDLNRYMPTSHRIKDYLKMEIGELTKGSTTAQGEEYKESSQAGRIVTNILSSLSNRGDRVDKSVVEAWSKFNKEDKIKFFSRMGASEVSESMKGKANLALRKKHGFHRPNSEMNPGREKMSAINIFTPKGRIDLFESDMGDGEKIYQMSHYGTKGEVVETSKQAFDSVLKNHKRRIDDLSNITTDELIHNPGLISEKWYGTPEVSMGKLEQIAPVTANDKVFNAIKKQ